MKIAVLAHNHHPINLPYCGGMEAHCHQLVKGLIRRGHQVHLYASGDSDKALPLKPVMRHHYHRRYPMNNWHSQPQYKYFDKRLYHHAMQMIVREGYDVVHNNSLSPTPIIEAQRLGIPMLTSMHVPPFKELTNAVQFGRAPWIGYTATSEAHYHDWQLSSTQSRVVHNGIALQNLQFSPQGNGRAIWAGRITPTKAPGLAAQAAFRANIPLDLYGPMEDANHFKSEVAPYLNDTVRYHGLIGFDKLQKRMSEASVLLFTPMWPEPFGLVAIEAMAGGTPIAAFDNGAIKEIIGDCGSYAPPGDIDALARAIKTAVDLPRATCRARVEKLFSQSIMLDGYELMYRRVMKSMPRYAGAA